MAHEYRYPLTRVCLRGGNMTLPRTMIGLFPDEGAVTVVDTLTGEEHVAHMSGPRVVSGLGPLYSVHGLDVNDELLVSQLDGERFAITAVARADEEAAAEDGEEDPGPEPASGSTEQQAQGASGASTEGSDAAPLAADRSDAQASEPTGGSSSAGSRQERRWVEDREAAAEPAWESGGGPGGDRTSLGEEQDPGRMSLDPRLAVRKAESALSELEHEGLAAAERQRAQPGPLGGFNAPVHGRGEGGPYEPSPGAREPHAGQADVRQARRSEQGARADQEDGQDADPGTDTQSAHGMQGTLWEPRGGAAAAATESAADSATDSATDPATDPAMDAGQRTASQPAARPSPPARGPAYKDAEEEAAALAAVALSSRLRRTFTRLGYRIEPLTTGVLFLHADLGRRRYKVLVQLLRSGERLDWAGLLARRRESPANYMSVIGDHVDLIRLSHPAELARATLWSWEALSRLEELHASVPVTPLDLETHFAHDGLFEKGLKRFEESVSARVAERGAASEVLTRLARNRAPSVFLLEELAQDVNLSRDVVLKILERFSEAPMHLVARVDSGEFLLRQPVDTALTALASYAQSLRQRLPVGRREVMTGLDDEEFGSDLLDDVPEGEGAARGAADQEPVPDQ